MHGRRYVSATVIPCVVARTPTVIVLKNIIAYLTSTGYKSLLAIIITGNIKPMQIIPDTPRNAVSIVKMPTFVKTYIRGNIITIMQRTMSERIRLTSRVFFKMNSFCVTLDTSLAC
jgi:hypothetical protein